MRTYTAYIWIINGPKAMAVIERDFTETSTMREIYDWYESTKPAGESRLEIEAAESPVGQLCH